MTRYVIAEDCFDVGRHAVADLPAMQPGDSVRVTRTEAGWGVRRLRAYSLKVPADAMCWADAIEQEYDR